MSAGDNRKRAAADPISGPSKKSKAVGMIEDLERLNCPICFELPRAEVYQCADGHSVCSKCIVKLKNCPTCAGLYEGGNGQGIRNRFAEEILTAVRFQCSWKEQGCDQQGLTGQQVTEHEEQCSFNPTPIKLCELLFGNDCGFEVTREFLRNPFLDLPAGLEDHLLAAHYTYSKLPIGATKYSGSTFTHKYAGSTMEILSKKKEHDIYGPLFRLMDQRSGNPVGMFMTWCSRLPSPANAKHLFWFFVRVTDPPKSCSVKVKFTLKSTRTSEEYGALNGETSWDGLIIGLHEFGKFETVAADERSRIAFSMPLSHLQKYYLDAEGGLDLQYVFTVTPHANSTPGDSSSGNKK